MKKLSIISILLASTLGTRASAGTLTVVGDQTVSTNLTAQSITLGGVKQTNWPGGFTGGVIDLNSAVLDFSQAGSFYRFTLTSNTTWVLTNHVAGRDILLQITENATGGWTNAWPSNLLWTGGQITNGPVTVNSISMFKILDNGAYWLIQADGFDYQVSCTNCYALAFTNAQNYVSVPGDSTHFYPTNFTVEAWIKPTSTARQFYFGTYDPSSGYLMHNESGGHIFADFSNIASVDTGISISTITNGNWHHLAFTYDGSTVQTFIDGSPKGSDSISPPHTNSSPFLIGGDNETGTPTGSFSGSIDEVRVSKSIRYTSGFTPAHTWTVDADTVAYWKFSEGTGTTAHDSSGNGHDGTLSGSPLPSWVGGF